MEARYAFGAFCVYVAADIAHWAMRGPSRDVIATRVILPIFLLTFVFVAVSVALHAGRHPILASAAVSGVAVFAEWVMKVPLTLVLPGLIQRDHDAWVEGLIWEAVQVGCSAAVIAAMLGVSARSLARLWRWRFARGL